MTQKKISTAARLLVTLAAFFFASAGYTQQLAPAAAEAAAASAVSAARLVKRADFGKEKPGRDARRLADWVVDSGDSKRMPFVVIDKIAARVFLFDADGQLRGAAAALLGIARGDDSAPGVGDRELSAIPLKDRTTPAGRFEASIGRNYHGKEILWVDYEASISMHPVINTVPSERRPHRLATETPLDNRISFGCINVPLPFFKDVVSPTFKGTSGVVYVLPEMRPFAEVFSTYDVDERAKQLARLAAPSDAGPLPAAPGVARSGVDK